MKITIRKKLASIITVVVLGMLLLYVESAGNQSDITKLKNIKQNLTKLQVAMLQLRRSEKDFMLRMDAKYLTTFDKQIKHSIDELEQLKKDLAGMDIPIGGVDDVERNMLQYQSKFNELVSAFKLRGLNKTDGEYGQLRVATHKLEAKFKELGDLLSHNKLLQLRRYEKDYLLRLDNKYSDAHSKAATELSYLFDDNDTKSLITEYMTRFQSLVKITEQIGLTSKLGIRGQMRSSVHSVETQLAEEIKRITEYANNYIKRSELTHIIFTVVVSLIIAGLVTIISKQIITPLEEFSKRISQIRESNDLSQRCDTRDDEIGKISEEFNIFMAHFQGLIKSINQTVNALSDSTEVVSNSVAKTSEGLVTQSTESDMVATAVNEMGIAANEIAGNAHLTKEKTDTAATKAASGKEKLDGTVYNINELSTELSQAQTQIVELEEKSNGITSVLEVIQGIAEQTNLLALNAAIEAARAGEQGRGFAVVADEVRTLAVRTQDSTAEISAIINDLQTSTASIVNTVNSCKEKGSVSAEQAKETEDVLNEIISDVGAIAEMTVQVATAVEEQSAVVQDVDQNIVRIRDIGNQVAEDSQENAIASQNVAELAQELHKEANIFKV